MTNATMQKFGWPETRIAELDHWAVMLRPQQCTLGALVLACKQPVTAFGQVDAAGITELGVAVKAVEAMLGAAIGYDKINYLMLMMVDPDVHFHVLPRYEGARSHAGLTLADAGWPAQPRLDIFTQPDPTQAAALIAHLRAHWPLDAG
ncbi:MAG TPA: HIT family protein [Thermohalobaculum sp.]|nr:HIT family protein [Thermohalobaculum sp.]